MSLTLKVTQNNANNTVIAANSAVSKQAENKGKSLFAGKVNSKTDALIDQKRKDAKKQAMKLVSDAWGKEQAKDKKTDDKRKLRDNLLTQIKDSKGRLADIDEAKGRLQQEYEIDPESQEQKDLELLEKYQDYLNGVLDGEFSDEEIDRIKELQFETRSEYQVEALKLNKDAANEKKSIRKLEWNESLVRGSISSDKFDKLKNKDMVNANDAADELKEASKKEILNLLIQEGKDNVDEKTEEDQEKVQQAQEKKEEQQERIDKAKEDKKDQEEIIEGEMEKSKLDMESSVKQNSVSHMEIAQKNVSKILKENHLVVEDLKGIEIDFGF